MTVSDSESVKFSKQKSELKRLTVLETPRCARNIGPGTQPTPSGPIFGYLDRDRTSCFLLPGNGTSGHVSFR